MRLGADPEVFLCDKQGKHISAIGLIRADKWNPLQIPDMEKGFTLQEDNVSLEYGIPPAASADEFVSHIQAVMEKSKEYVGGLTFSNLSCTIFSKDQMKHPMAHVFGCEPDFDAWSNNVNVKPKPPHPFMRSAGGHVHVETKKDPLDVVKRMDLYLSVPAVIMDQKGTQRKKLYGGKGAHRTKPYGVEYRSLSNFWIFEEKYIRWVWAATERALNTTHEINDLEQYLDMAINKNDDKMAWALINEFNLDVVQ
jgi:hypothetical protein